MSEEKQEPRKPKKEKQEPIKPTKEQVVKVIIRGPKSTKTDWENVEFQEPPKKKTKRKSGD